MSTERATVTQPEIEPSLEQSQTRPGTRTHIGKSAINRVYAKHKVRKLIAETDTGPADEKARRRKNRVRKSMAALTLASTVTGGAWAGTSIVENNHYNKQTTVESVASNPLDTLFNKNTTHEAFENSSWMVVPGFNMSWYNSRETAKTIDESLGETGDMAWAGFSDKELSIDILFDKTMQYIEDNNKDEIRLYGCSFGGMLSIELAIRLQEAGIKVPMIVLDSSPAAAEDVIDQTGLDLASSAWMGPIPYSARKSYDQHGWNLPQMATDIYTDLTARNDENEKRLSSVAVGDQAKYIRNADVKNLSEKLSSDTKIVYIGSENDQTILTKQAYAHYQEMFSDRYIRRFDSSPAGHASPIGNPEVYVPILISITESLLPPKVPGQMLPNQPR